MDELDMAQAHMENELAARIAARVRYEGESLRECESCGKPIPKGRREAVPGCRLCVECQRERE